MIDKTRLAQQFGQSAAYYHDYAKVQQYAANRLLRWLAECSIPPGKVLELGCGTGFLSQGLVDLYPDHDLEISDLSPQILQFCQAHLHIPHRQIERVKFSVVDAESLDVKSLGSFPPHRYRLITSSFVWQWFANPVGMLEKLYHYLQPGGILLLSFPSSHSFPELKTTCNDRQIPYPLNPLPDFKTIAEKLYHLGLSCEYRLEWYSETYPSFKCALQHLKDLGAGLSTLKASLSYTQMKTLLNPKPVNAGEKAGITVSYHLVFLSIVRPTSELIGDNLINL